MLVQESVGEIRFGTSQSGSCKNNFEKLLIEAADTVFSSLGDQCKQALYFHLKHYYNIGKQ